MMGIASTNSESEKFRILQAEVVRQSIAPSWEGAKREWYLVHIYEEPGGTCVCTHPNITKRCVIRNRENGIELVVGNTCVGHFDEDDGTKASSAFESLVNLREDPMSKKPNQALLDLGLKFNVITTKSFTFASGLLRKKKPTIKQLQWRQDINHALLAAFSQHLP
ncbi:hypothetical protein HKX48_007166 [Thoreauomyces humboldtii]|nr:hypothetical protein HKX48_007166 [Thoreauomyces humboldtii]